MTVTCLFSNAQSLEEQVATDRFNTYNTISNRYGQWFHFASCEITSPFQDYGTTFEILGNGSGNGKYYYGKLVARFKRQASTIGPITHYQMILFNSNIGAENIKAVRNDTKVDIYVKINNSYTTLYCRRMITGNSMITALQLGTFHKELPQGDLVIDCEYPKQYASNLDVKGIVSASEIKVEAQTADFVFEEDYPLKSLKEVEQFIITNKHLPDIPSAKQMEKDGVGLAEMNKLLLQKVEELTLYVIEQQKEIVQLKAKEEKFSDLEKSIELLNQRLNELK